jgi:hypothetical protein
MTRWSSSQEAVTPPLINIVGKVALLGGGPALVESRGSISVEESNSEI